MCIRDRNKPEGVVSAAQDKRDTTVVDLVKDAFPDVYKRQLLYYTLFYLLRQEKLAAARGRCYNIKEYILFLPCVPFGHSSAGHTHL